MRLLKITLATFCVAACLPNAARADIVSLASGNSTVSIKTSGAGASWNEWTLDGLNYLVQQSYWYRVGASGPEKPLEALPSAYTVTKSDPLEPADIAKITYTGPGFKVILSYWLTGGDSAGENADMALGIKIQNTSSSANLNFHFFQYSNFDLGGKGPNQVAEFKELGRVRQTDQHSLYEETVVTSAPSRYEIGTPSGLLGKLNDGVASNLSNAPAVGTWTSPNDIAWAMQWDRTIAKSSAFLISEDTLIDPVPEPAGIVLGGTALAAVVLARARRSRLFRG
jgi:hypothetical protein